MWFSNHILSVVLFLPLAGAIALMFLPKENKNLIRWVANLVGSAQNPVTLLTGSFSSFQFGTTQGGGLQFSGTGLDTKNTALLTALGIPVTTPFSFFGFVLALAPTGDGTYIPFSIDLANTAIPEPGTMMLLGLGTGLLGLAAIARRRSKKS